MSTEAMSGPEQERNKYFHNSEHCASFFETKFLYGKAVQPLLCRKLSRYSYLPNQQLPFNPKVEIHNMAIGQE